MKKIEKRYQIILWVAFCIFYAFLSARPVNKETVLVPLWISSLESGYTISAAGASRNQETRKTHGNKVIEENGEPIPFNFGGRFGYFYEDGNFAINEVKTGNVGQSGNLYAEFHGQPELIEVKNILGETVLTLKNKDGYPFFIDNRLFILSSEQNSISELSLKGDTLWSYDFSSPVTCADAAAGLLATGEINGTISLINTNGQLFWTTEPSGSRIPAIFGCAISRDGTRMGVISGIDSQRFLFIEKDNASYKIGHHEFLGKGFRRPVFIKFENDEKKLVYERQGGLGIYDTSSRLSYFIPFEGRVAQMDSSGGDGLLFLITTAPEQQDGANGFNGEVHDKKNLIAIRYPDDIMISAPFKSKSVFLERSKDLIFVGGGRKLACFKIEKQ